MEQQIKLIFEWLVTFEVGADDWGFTAVTDNIWRIYVLSFI